MSGLRFISRRYDSIAGSCIGRADVSATRRHPAVFVDRGNHGCFNTTGSNKSGLSGVRHVRSQRTKVGEGELSPGFVFIKKEVCDGRGGPRHDRVLLLRGCGKDQRFDDYRH
jgi:hypothetical protein